MFCPAAEKEAFFLRFLAPYLFYIFTGFLSGSVLYSKILPWQLKRVDVTLQSDDGNPGTTNAIHCAGVPIGLLCLVCDLGKGFLPVWLGCRRLDVSCWWFALVLAAPVFGPASSLWMRGSGGKAVAASFGVMLGLLPGIPAVWLLAGLYIFFSVVVAVRPHRLRSVLVYGLFAALSLLLPGPFSLSLGYLLLSGAVISRHLPRKTVEAPEVLVLGRRIGAGK